MRLASLRAVDARTGLIPTAGQCARRALFYMLSLATLGVGLLLALAAGGLAIAGLVAAAVGAAALAAVALLTLPGAATRFALAPPQAAATPAPA
jgi:hypothetical protein